MILLPDASVLIDLGYVNGLALLPALGPTEVLSTMLLECHHPQLATLMQDILAVGIIEIEVDPQLADAAKEYPREDLSFKDRQALLYARDQGRILLSNDRPVREAAREERMQVHSAIWLIQEAHRLGLYPTHELYRWLCMWPLVRRRLPAHELRRLKALLGCP